MTVWAIIPMKPLRLGKSRLSSTLTEVDRYVLSRCLFENTLNTLRSVPEIERIMVISRDPQVLSLARSHEALTIQESGSSDLNAALEKATQVALRYAVQSLLILPADLPLVNATDLQTLVGYSKGSPILAIVPDRHHKGTNALLVSPAGLIHYAFGEDSFELHCQFARQNKIRLEIIELPRLALDLDNPDDIEFLKNERNLQIVC